MTKHFESEAGHESISDEELAAYESISDEEVFPELTTEQIEEIERRDAAVMRVLNESPLLAKPDNSFVLCWSKPGFGWGEATFYFSSHEGGDVKLYCDNEGMSKEFIKEMFATMVDISEFKN